MADAVRLYDNALNLITDGTPYLHAREFSDVRCSPEPLNTLLRWRKPRRVMVPSMGDLFHPSVPNEFVAAAFGTFAAVPQHAIMILTKRPERALDWFQWVRDREVKGRSMFPDDTPEWRIWHMIHVEARRHGINVPNHHGGQWPLPNVWFGFSAENQEAFDKRAPIGLQVPAALHFVSVEPMLGPVNIPDKYLLSCRGCGNQGSTAYVTKHDLSLCCACEKNGEKPALDWVICGGETGPGARPLHPDWVRGLRDQCEASGVPFFFKSWGDWGYGGAESTHAFSSNGKLYKIKPYEDAYGDWPCSKVGKRKSGRELDWKIWDQIPEVKS